MNAKAKFQVRGWGDLVPLGKELGRGGEGSVYEVENRHDMVAKLYHKPISKEKADKIEAMVSMKTDRLLSQTAWPMELLREPNGAPCGLLMPKVSGHKDIHHLFAPKSRKVEFPDANWPFLLRTAFNTATAFAAVHEAGCVIGDVNHGGVMVSHNATIKLIDCDSFQVSVRGKMFLCEVGVPDFTPPELQGKSFKGVVRTPNHDNFGLAVQIFRLLFMGRHPFAGRFLGKGDMPIEKAIAEFRFSYGSGRGAAQMEPPPGMPEIISAFSMPVVLLLERAFSRDSLSGSRPTASEWVTVLGGLEKQIKQCRVNDSHHHVDSLQSCPWCYIEAKTGAMLFNLSIRHQGGGTSTFNITATWARIASISPPAPTPGLLDRQNLGAIKPCQAAVDAGGSQAIRILGAVLVAIISIILCLVYPKAWFLWLAGGFWLAKVALSRDTKNPVIADFTTKHSDAEGRYRAIKTQWDKEATDKQFTVKLRELEECRSQWSEIPNTRKRCYRQLEQEREKAQRKRFMEQFTIDRATIQGVGPSRKAMLESYNIETAWDVTEQNVRNVPGFGPVLTTCLLEWRSRIERQFRFDSSKGVDPHDVEILDREMKTYRQKLEQSLITGPTALTQIKNQITIRQNVLKPQVNDAYRSMLQAEVDMHAARA